ncbi:hypothetical protein PoB_002473000 [Plakobranchus ocellatus]|uniref:Uncharacterized protein n=1 Tax=Plakobranchus ocellatus TaxID=259542 RepID=A0AAV3ZR62_9GAST|nr:hypothetical protein PoB_002473000 [Plakobranchus ocellatus]
MHILKEFWTKEIHEPDVKSSYEYVLNLWEWLDNALQIAFGSYDYRINVKWKEKNVHANLLKRYITKVTTMDETLTDDISLPAASLAVVEDDDKCSSCEDYGFEILPEFVGWDSKETVKDMKFGDELLQSSDVN